MSLETWKAEFYPVPASEVPEEDAVAHSLQKWIGLRQSNLDKHEVVLHDNGVGDRDDDWNPLGIDSTTCALCRHHLLCWHDLSGVRCQCKECPLGKHLGRACDGSDDSPYLVFEDTGDPEPMIKALIGTMEQENAKSDS